MRMSATDERAEGKGVELLTPFEGGISSDELSYVEGREVGGSQLRRDSSSLVDEVRRNTHGGSG